MISSFLGMTSMAAFTFTLRPATPDNRDELLIGSQDADLIRGLVGGDTILDLA
jgi:hypothetical protein